MHWLVPCAGSADAPAREALARVPLTHLQALLDRLVPAGRLGGDEHSFSPPHEQALAQALGLPLADGQLPWAALDSATPHLPQAWVHPVHFQVGMDAVRLTPAEHVGLNEADARALFEALAPLCAEDGVHLAFDHPTRWRLSGERLRHLACASLDRVSGRSVAAWLPKGTESGWLKRLQSEAQMLFYTHPVNDARERAGQMAINGIWLSAPGAAPEGISLAPPPQVHEGLREAALRADTAAWTAAWAALDAGPLQAALQQVRAGHTLRLTLCGERQALSFTTPSARGLMDRLKRAWGRTRSPRAHDLLASL